MKRVFKTNLEKPERKLSTRESVFMSSEELSSTWKSSLQESQVLSSFPYILL